MDFREYQQKSKLTFHIPDGIILHDDKDFKTLLGRISLGVAGETGEICEKVKKFLRGDDMPTFSNDLGKEIGDVLWYLAILADLIEVDLQYIAEKNVEKLQSRKERGKIQGSGDSR